MITDWALKKHSVLEYGLIQVKLLFDELEVVVICNLKKSEFAINLCVSLVNKQILETLLWSEWGLADM